MARGGMNHSGRLVKMPEPVAHGFSPREMLALEAICDTLLAPMPGKMEASLDLMQKLPDWVAGLMVQRLKPSKLRAIRIVLWLLTTPLGSLLLLGFWSLSWTFPWVRSFPWLPAPRREKALLSLATSRFVSIRALFKLLKSYCCCLYLTVLDEQGHSPVQEALGYSVPHVQRADAVSPESEALAGSWHSTPSESSDEDDPCHGQAQGVPGSGAGAHVRRTARMGKVEGSGIRASVVDAAASWPRLAQEMRLRGFEARAADQQSLGDLHRALGVPLAGTSGAATDVVCVECDAVVIGSGCGGSVVAAQLAQARPGSRVLVLEKGRHYSGADFSQLEAPSMRELYENGGFLTTEDGSMSILSGTCVGGGSVVNWSASFRTPPHVRTEWAEEYGLKQFQSSEFDAAMDAVCQRIGVNTDNTEHNLNNAVLKEGCAALGYPCLPTPRNAAPPHACGWCHFGCRDGGKNCAASTWLHDAVGHGAVIISSARADRLTFAPKEGNGPKGRRRRASGVLALVDDGTQTGPAQAEGEGVASRHVWLQAPLVVVACGSIQTPALLLRSGLQNPNIGAHLRLHPVCAAVGSFPDEDPILLSKFPSRNPEGGIMTAWSGLVANWHSSGYGALIQTPCAHPGIAAAALPWHGKEHFARMILRYGRTAILITITRDCGRGRVYLDGQGEVAIDYDLNSVDSESMQAGLRASLNILRAAGAHEVCSTHQSHLLSFACGPESSDADFERFLRSVEKAGLGKNEIPLFSAHQMGSCPMGVDARSSVVDENGEDWDVSGLFLADGSVFPSPSGVNPMVTVESVAFLIGSRLSGRFTAGEFKPASENTFLKMPKL